MPRYVRAGGMSADDEKDIEAAPETEPEAEAEQGEAFVASEEFDGARDGYTFKVRVRSHSILRIMPPRRSLSARWPC